MRRRVVLTVSGLMIASTLVGCRASQYRNNPTPKLDNLAWTRDEIDNRIAITNDTNLRTLNNDLGRLMLLDRPSNLRIGPPVPYGHN